LHTFKKIGVLAKPPLTKQEYDKQKAKRECAVHAFQHPLLRLPDSGKRARNKANPGRSNQFDRRIDSLSYLLHYQ
jgi:hypothetical protein